MTEFTWGSDAFPLQITSSATRPTSVAVAPGDAPIEPRLARHRSMQALVEALTLGEGRGLTNVRHVRTALGDRLRLVETRASQDEARGSELLEIVQRDSQSGIEARTTIERFTGVDAYRFETTLRNDGIEPIVLQAVSSAALTGLSRFLGPAAQTSIYTAANEWCAESRWAFDELTGPHGIPDINAPLHSHSGRGMYARTGTSTWSSGEYVPVAGAVNRATNRALIWQVENNGPWHWELVSQFDTDDWLALVLLGPTDLHHSWSITLEPGEEFRTVPVSVALGEGGIDGANRALTQHRRRSRAAQRADAGRPLIFNDYMNALMGDPTTEKLLPLIDAAARAGADYFCIDAGWYDDGGDWWPSVGEWLPSSRRFGELGLSGVLEHIRSRGMRTGLWVEPEVVGVHSPLAQTLPDEAFMRRRGVRIVEHERYFLDLRNDAARNHLDAVFDRLIGEYGVRYFKWDYNVTPGVGPDTDAMSPGEALLGHARAHLDWFERLRSRYPEVIFEACSSGAQRMDGAILSRYDLQSTSDQQDYRLYPPIAASAGMAMPLEQAGNWAYPQSEWTDEQIAFTLVTGLSGRLYLSGNIDRLDDEQFAIVREATANYPEIIAHHEQATPRWPLGLPGWNDAVVALASATDDETYLFVWNRGAKGATVPLPQFAGQRALVETVFPTMLTAWATEWSASKGELQIDFRGTSEAARVLRIRAN